MRSVKTCRLGGFKDAIDVNQLNINIARWFENPDLVDGAKTRAILVLYKVSGESLSRATGKAPSTTFISLRRKHLHCGGFTGCLAKAGNGGTSSLKPCGFGMRERLNSSGC